MIGGEDHRPLHVAQMLQSLDGNPCEYTRERKQEHRLCDRAKRTEGQRAIPGGKLHRLGRRLGGAGAAASRSRSATVLTFENAVSSIVVFSASSSATIISMRSSELSPISSSVAPGSSYGLPCTARSWSRCCDRSMPPSRAARPSAATRESRGALVFSCLPCAAAHRQATLRRANPLMVRELRVRRLDDIGWIRAWCDDERTCTRSSPFCVTPTAANP